MLAIGYLISFDDLDDLTPWVGHRNNSWASCSISVRLLCQLKFKLLLFSYICIWCMRVILLVLYNLNICDWIYKNIFLEVSMLSTVTVYLFAVLQYYFTQKLFTCTSVLYIYCLLVKYVYLSIVLCLRLQLTAVYWNNTLAYYHYWCQFKCKSSPNCWRRPLCDVHLEHVQKCQNQINWL